MTNYAPDVQAEINKQLVEAQVAELTRGGVEFKGDIVADNALLSEGNLVGAMQQSSDPGSRDKVTIYSTDTGLPSRVLVNMLGKKLSMRNADGSPVWSQSPVKDYFVGDMKCLLHKDHPRRSEWDGIGLSGAVCDKSNIPSVFQVRQHMLSRHKQEWEVMEEERFRVEREEERAFRKMQMEQWQAQQSRRGRPAKDDGLEL
jgi:hypothetical protein